MTNPKPAVNTTPISRPPNNAPSIGPVLVLDDLPIIIRNTYQVHLNEESNYYVDALFNFQCNNL